MSLESLNKGIRLDKGIRIADIIVVAQISAYSPDPAALELSPPNTKAGAGTPRIFTVQELARASEFKASGTYTFNTRWCIKGSCDSKFQLKLEALRSEYHGNSSPNVSEGSWVVL